VGSDPPFQPPGTPQPPGAPYEPPARRLEDPASLHDLQTLHRRRDERRRALRRRRGVAAAALLAALVAVAVVLASSGGGSSRAGAAGAATGGSTSTQQPSAAHSATHSTVAANATGGTPGHTPVPILMYHVIAPAPAGAPFPGLYVTPQEFGEQMQALAGDGWHAVTLDQLEAYWRKGVPLGPGKPIVLSFDNGYQSQYTQALPVLKSHGWVGDENIQLSGLPPSQGGLSRRQIRGLVSAGWELDTQGLDHADLITLDASALHEQVATTRQTIQSRYHVPVNWFCYPSGHYDPTVVEAVKNAGYQGATTVVPGWAQRSEDPYRLHRLRVLGGTSGTELLQLISDTRADPASPGSYSA
jgi:peptidoglycan/xylan/chitin deacetylase (PgdA/CDA1 family)